MLKITKNTMQKAISNNEFVPYVQPYVNKELRVIGLEVLARWNKSGKELVKPDSFIPFAEETGLIIPITTSLMEQVKNNILPYQHYFPENFTISFNISATNCESESLLNDSLNFVNSLSNKTIKLCLELTENIKIENKKAVASLFDCLKKEKILLAIDDFGTGHANFDCLQYYNFDILKIDRKFASATNEESSSNHIVESLHNLSHKLGMKTCIEGVETKSQEEYFKNIRVDYMQGYLFFKPMPISKFIKTHLHTLNKNQIS